MRRSTSLFLALSLFTAFAGASRASAQTNPWRWQKAMSRGSTVEIRGVIGDIVAVPGDGSVVEVVAKISDGNDVRLVAVETVDGVTICALYPSRNGYDESRCQRGGSHGGNNSGNNSNNSGNNETRVDFEVRVPRGIRLEAGTVAGDVRATGMTDFVTGSSVSGDVRITTSDLARASSVSGSVDVTMGRSDWDGKLSFSSVSGDVTITMPGQLNTEFSASTVSGDIESDWPISMNRTSRNSVKGTIGNGGRSLSISTVSGNVTLHRQH